MKNRPGSWQLILAALLVSALFSAGGCGTEKEVAGDPPAVGAPSPPEEPPPVAAPFPSELVLNGLMPFEGVLVGGQPTPEQFSILAKMGYKTVINMRLPEEEGSTPPESVEGLGMKYVAIPLPGMAGITEENARKLAEVLDGSEGPVLIHCASGNRIGAILGMKAWKVDGATTEEAMEIARRAGITRLEPSLMELMGIVKDGGSFE